MPPLLPSSYEHLFDARDAARAAREQLLRNLQNRPATPHDVIMHREFEQAEAAATGRIVAARDKSLNALRAFGQGIGDALSSPVAGLFTLVGSVVAGGVLVVRHLNHARNFPAARVG
jgi:hypothetical protein